MAQAHAFFFSKKKDSKKNSTRGGFTHFSFFLNYLTQIIVMKCEGTQGRSLFSNDIFAVVAILCLEFFNTKEFKALSAKK